jgi:hypothetical protein
MTIKAMDEILSRMVLDKSFRELLHRDPEQALAGYDLTPLERAAWFKLKKRSFSTEQNPSRLSFSEF